METSIEIFVLNFTNNDTVHIHTPDGKYLFRANSNNSRTASIVIDLVNLLLTLNRCFSTEYGLHLYIPLVQASSKVEILSLVFGKTGMY